MNVLVTGATGFIGKHLVEDLSKLGKYNIFCLVRNSNKVKTLEGYGVKLVYADITQKSSLDNITDYKIDVVFHCAGYVNDGNPSLLHKTNVVGTENICELSLRLGVERIVYLSSVAVVSGNDQVPLREELPYKATNAYGQSKIEAEKKVLQYRKKGLKAVIIRPCMVYGEGEPHMMRFLLFLMRHRLLFLLNEGKSKFHLVYVKNVTELMIFSLGEDAFLKDSFFAVDREVLTTKEVFEIFRKSIGAKNFLNIPRFLTPLLLNIPYIGRRLKLFLKDRVFSIERLKETGFIPPYSAKENLNKSAKWFMHRQNSKPPHLKRNDSHLKARCGGKNI